MANTIKFKRASGSDPTASDLAIGEPGLRTDTAELFFKKDNGTIAKVSGGGGGPDFKYLELRNAANNGAASFPGNDFTLVLAGTTTAISPAAANTLLVSVSGVVQKPNAGTSTSGITGFIVDGSRFKTATNLPAAPDFIVYQESGGIGEPSDNTVTSAKIVDGTIVNADINASAAIDGSKINPTFSSGQTITVNSDGTNPVLKVQGNGPNFITFASDGSGTVDSDSINLVYRTSPNTLAFERASDNAVLFSVDADNGAIIGAGNLTIDTNTLHVDASNNRVGIGTASPAEKLVVSGAIVASGAVSNPSSYTDTGLYIQNKGSSVFDLGAWRSGASVSEISFSTDSGSDAAPVERMRLDKDGNLGIGTTSPSVKLDVAGALKVSGNVTIDAFSNPTTTTLSLRSGVNATQTGGMGLAAKDHSGANADGLAVYGHDGISFHTSQAERIRIDNVGRIVPADSLDILSTLRTQGQTFVKLTGHNTSNFSLMVFGANSGGHNTASCAIALGKNSNNSRSLNAAGTVNASGNDYAEYMTKSSDFTIKKGDICGINANGKLTNKFSESITFVVKSTNPSYVGGDVWGTEEILGEKPNDDSPDLPAFEEKLEAARNMVDRIAFSGQVPVNVTDATAGQHIIPIAGSEDTITGVAKGEKDLSMSEYMSSVGKVIALESDGRAKIIVKVS